MGDASREPPRSVRRLLLAFEAGLRSTLGGNLVGSYLLGSIVFPGFSPHLADIDFLVVLRREPSGAEHGALDALHRRLARRYAHGGRLDGLYIPIAKARRRGPPEGVLFAASGRVGAGGFDGAWALHREHIHRRAVRVLHGPDPVRIVPRATDREIGAELAAELRAVTRVHRRSPTYSVMNLCRLLMTWTTREVALSKKQAAAWALRRLPGWRPLVEAARKDYDGRATRRDRTILRRQTPRFVRFATRAIRQISGRTFRRA